MSTQVVLNLPDDTYERVAQFAAYAKRNVSEIIAAALASALPSLDALAQLRHITKLSDREVLALTELRMAPEADRRLSELLAGAGSGFEMLTMLKSWRRDSAHRHPGEISLDCIASVACAARTEHDEVSQVGLSNANPNASCHGRRVRAVNPRGCLRRLQKKTRRSTCA